MKPYIILGLLIVFPLLHSCGMFGGAEPEITKEEPAVKDSSGSDTKENLEAKAEEIETLKDEEYRKEIQTSIGVVHELGAPVFVCGVSLNDRGLTATMNDYKFLNSSAPKRISQVVSKGWQVAVF